MTEHSRFESGRRVHPDVAHQRTTGSLLSEAMNHVSNLVRKEVDLARAEISSNIKTAVAGIVMLVIAAVLAIVGLNVLAAAATAAVAEGFDIDAGWAALIVGGGILLICLILAAIGASRLKATNLAPTRTVENVKRDAHAVKEAV
ncbi:putative superfamily III holin-X [Hasllibacter halocynthiae]|uniref:Putative superfamily III holin-X n=1 Tax=Hasllibacter halocynthiae TaxID=595589 RepID=A0A2T0X474_9RHOB|nr:phage holin family protein [Hasllibacter halocynthiae]PRY93742.1 putative superfamily III holin-X [Hasllibacter halocynthiae]